MNKRIGELESRDVFVAVIVLGSFFGFSEVVFDEIIRNVGLPARAGILTGIGMMTMGVLFGFVRKAPVLLAIPFVAVTMKQLAVPILGTSIMCGANSCLAVILQGSVLTGIMAVMNRSISNPRLFAVGGFSGFAALLSSVPFYFVGLSLAPCNYLLSFARPGGFFAFLIREGLVWGLFTAVLFPLGFYIGKGVREAFLGKGRNAVIAPYYAFTMGVAVCLWVASSAFIFISGS